MGWHDDVLDITVDRIAMHDLAENEVLSTPAFVLGKH